MLYLNSRIRPGKIPAEYQDLYQELDTRLTGFEKTLESQPKNEGSPVIFAAEFLAANGNRGKALLKEEDYPYILKYLDGLQVLGIKGVKISINYPLFVSDFPDSEKYLEFYRELAQEIRVKRGLKLLIQATAMFTQKEFADTSLPTRQYYQNLTLEKYLAGKQEHLTKIISQVQPDYLTVETEPDTMFYLTGLEEMATVKGFGEIVKAQVTNLEHSQTLIGAGVGTWSRKEFVEELTAIPELDYLDLHIYPFDYLENTLTYIDLAKSRDKKVIIGEAWAYKAARAELNVEQAGQAAAWAKIISRDVFSFWQPLDQTFLETLTKVARTQGVEFVSSYWSNYFFSYLDYGWTTRLRSPHSRLRLAQKQAIKKLTRGEFSQTGLKYQELISQQ